MYNRYIPQSDGTYRRNRMQDAAQQNKPPQYHAHTKTGAKCEVPPRSPCACEKSGTGHSQNESSIPGFLRQLLPKNFDTADLLVIVLLLLMSGDCQEDQNWALLTLVLYLFL